MDQLEITGTWDWEIGLDECAVKRQIMEFFLQEANVPVYIKDKFAVPTGGVVEYTATADVKDYATLVSFSEERELELGFSDLS